MNKIQIRNFRYTDVEALLDIAQVSFADEMTAEGMTPEAFAQQVRRMAAGRMLPFTLLTAVRGVTWELLVAEIEGVVVGCGMYSGRRHMYLSTLMVAPAYRRQGIGQALLMRRIQRIAERNYPAATVKVLSTNQASLGNLRKQDFEVCDRYSIYEHRLPLSVADHAPLPAIVGRPVRAADKPMFVVLEQQTTHPVVLHVSDSLIGSYFPSVWDRMFDHLAQDTTWSRSFELNHELKGFLAVTTSQGQSKGLIMRPVVPDEHVAVLPAMIHEAAGWLTRAGKTAVQIIVPDDRAQIAESLEQSGWTKAFSWIQLVKWLDERARTSAMKGSVQAALPAADTS